MEFEFDLQRFGGGHSSTTTVQKRDIPNETTDERAMRLALEKYNGDSMRTATDLRDRATGLIDKAYTPDWGQLINNYQNNTAQALADYKSMSADQQKSFMASMNDYLNQNQAQSQQNLDAYRQAQGQNTGTYDNAISNAKDAYNQAYNAAQKSYQSANESNIGAYNTDMDDINSRYKDLSNGVLSAEYAKNRQQALNSDLDRTMGDALSNLASRGIIDSSVTQGSMNDISRNASDTLAKNYTSDLATESGLLGNRAASVQNTYNTRMGNAKDLYGVQTGGADKIYSSDVDAAGKQYAANGTDNSNFFTAAQKQADARLAAQQAAQNTLFGSQQQYATNLLNGNLQNQQQLFADNATGQINSWSPIGNLYGYASQLQAPEQNMWGNMYSGRMGSGTVTQTATSNSNEGKGGIWNGIGSIGAAVIGGGKK